jgi:hypothetical protein
LRARTCRIPPISPLVPPFTPSPSPPFSPLRSPNCQIHCASYEIESSSPRLVLQDAKLHAIGPKIFFTLDTVT